MNSSVSGPTIAFTAVVTAIDSVPILRLPDAASARLPSRGQVAVTGTIAGEPLQTVVEPDGRRGHWLRLPAGTTPDVEMGGAVDVELVVAAEWPEPTVPADLRTALMAAPAEVQQLWREITPMARWEWVRWVEATGNPSTRARRVEVSVSKLDSGKRRPCCFDLSACTDPSLGRSGKLREST